MDRTGMEDVGFLMYSLGNGYGPAPMCQHRIEGG